MQPTALSLRTSSQNQPTACLSLTLVTCQYFGVQPRKMYGQFSRFQKYVVFGFVFDARGFRDTLNALFDGKF